MRYLLFDQLLDFLLCDVRFSFWRVGFGDGFGAIEGGLLPFLQLVDPFARLVGKLRELDIQVLEHAFELVEYLFELVHFVLLHLLLDSPRQLLANEGLHGVCIHWTASAAKLFRIGNFRTRRFRIPLPPVFLPTTILQNTIRLRIVILVFGRRAQLC